MVSMWESLEPQGCESNSLPLPPPEMPTSDLKGKKKVCVYLSLYMNDSGMDYLYLF